MASLRSWTRRSTPAERFLIASALVDGLEMATADSRMIDYAELPTV